MSSRTTDPRHLDVAHFAADSAHAEGAWPIESLSRLRDVVPAEAPLPFDEVHWSADGETRRAPGSSAQVWLHLHAHAKVWMECQRCLLPVELPLEVDRAIRFVPGEAEAARLDAESDDDVLELPRSLDLRELLEDELVLVLPIVPKHEICPVDLPMSAEADEADADEAAAPNPFAVLAALKRPPKH